MSTLPASTVSPQARPWLAAAALGQRELVRFFRQRNRVIGALGQPLLFWLLLGAGFSRSFELSPAGESGQSFTEYYFPGTLVLVVLFTAIFATISIIEDRKEGFLQSVLVSPAPRWSMVLGKVWGGAAIAMIQALLFLLLSLTLNVHYELWSMAGLVALLALLSLSLTSLGFVLAWRMESTQGFHAIMNLLLMPMWLLSGAFFPVPAAGGSVANNVLHWVMTLNPLTYGLAGMRQLMYAGGGEILPPGLGAGSEMFWLPSLTTCWSVTITFTILSFVAAWAIARQGSAGDLQ